MTVAPDSPGSALAGTRWIAQLINGREITGAPAPQIAFTEQDRVRGSGGCNAVFGVYEAADGNIDLRALGRSELACEAPVMAQENAFLSILDKATSYREDGERLEIIAADGGSVVFRAGSL